MRKFLIFIISLLLFANICISALAAEAHPTSSSVYIDGREIKICSYTIDGNNYFKLRDLAFLFNETAKQFEVGYDSLSKNITITTGQSYTQIGGELNLSNNNSENADITATTIIKDGETINFNTYIINGNNYFKLRDMGSLLNFGVNWDAENKAVSIDTTMGYISEDIANNPLIQEINDKNKELDAEINKLEELMDSGKKPFDEDIIASCTETLKKAKASKIAVEELSEKTIDMLTKNKETGNSIDYSYIINQLEGSYIALNNSIKQYEHFINPTEKFVIQCLAKVDEISASKAVTEDNDPNGKLNKAGGYTTAVYFTSKNVDQSKVHGSTIIEKGTDGGGSIEVYANEEDAEARDTYLSAFDGSVLDSGSHKVVGTVIIRTSDKLTATQQKNLESKIIEAFAEL